MTVEEMVFPMSVEKREKVPMKNALFLEKAGLKR